MSFFQVPFKITERSDTKVSYDKPSSNELEKIIQNCKYQNTDSLQKAEEFREKYIEYVKKSGNRAELSKAFIQLAFAVIDSHPKFGLKLIHDCLSWYPGQHWVMSRYISYLDKIGKPQLAIENYWRLLRHFPENPHAYTQLGNFLVKHGYYNMALIVIKAAVRNFSEDSITLNCLADVYLKSGHFEQAIICYKDSVKRFPGNPINITGLADAYLKSGRIEEAISTYQLANSTHPNDMIIMSGMADAFLKNGDIDKSIECYLNVIKLFPNTVISRAGLADAYFKNKQYDKSIEAYKNALNNYSTNHVSLNGLGSVYLKTKNYSKAITIFKKTVSLYPQGQVGLNGLASSYLRNGNIEESIEIYKNSLVQYPENHFFYEGLAEAYIVSKDYTKAESIIKDGFIKFNSNAKLIGLLIEVKLLMHKVEEAEIICYDAKEQFPEKSRFYLEMVLIKLYQKKFEDVWYELEHGIANFKDDNELMYLKEKLTSKSITSEKHNFASDIEYISFLDQIISDELLMIRDYTSRTNDQGIKLNRSRKYSYYLANITDELQRMLNNNYKLQHILVMIVALIFDDQEEDISLSEINEIWSFFEKNEVDDYDRKLLDIILEIKPNSVNLADKLEEIEKLISENGQKWELQLLKNIAITQKSNNVDDVNWIPIIRNNFQNIDFNEYLYSFTYSLAGNIERAESIYNNLQKKIQSSPSPRQKILWLFDQSKTSFRNKKSSWKIRPLNHDWQKIRMILLSDFYPLLNMDINTDDLNNKSSK